jgi:hypothetical protein
MGRLLDVGTTTAGLSLGLVEMNPLAFTTVGYVMSGLVVVCFLLCEWLSGKVRVSRRVVVGLSFITWGAALWNLSLILRIIYP